MDAIKPSENSLLSIITDQITGRVPIDLSNPKIQIGLHSALIRQAPLQHGPGHHSNDLTTFQYNLKGAYREKGEGKARIYRILQGRAIPDQRWDVIIFPTSLEGQALPGNLLRLSIQLETDKQRETAQSGRYEEWEQENSRNTERVKEMIQAIAQSIHDTDPSPWM